ncbi:hypothetical protein [Ensifer sp. NM-2]|uniref:hypothetical protein n=1 Tax=Ensifer sp. NM-2 TaxID=2109730 RepID=UPI00130505F0|nr:hypothetical protein [Ensifer sp. NM-2]
MKIIIAAVASLAFAGSAFAAVSSAPDEKQTAVKTHIGLELAYGRNRMNAISRDGPPASEKKAQDKRGAASSNGKSFYNGN